MASKVGEPPEGVDRGTWARLGPQMRELVRKMEEERRRKAREFVDQQFRQRWCQPSVVTFEQKSAMELLGVAPGCTDNDVRRAFRVLAAKLHPDRQQGASAERLGECEQMMRRLSAAQSLLVQTP